MTLIIKHRDENGKYDGREIHLDDKTNDISKLKCQLMLLGMNGLAYSEIWNKIAKKIHKLEEKEKK